MYTPSPYSPRNRWRTFNGLCDTAQMMGERHYAYPDRGDTPYSECVEENAGSRASSSVERWVAKNLSKAGFEVTRHARVHASIAPFCGVAPIRLSPDIIVNRHTVVEVDYPADGGGGPSHVRGFPARDMVRLDFFRAVGFDTVAVRLGGLEPIPGHTCVLSDGGITPAVLDETLAACAVWDFLRQETSQTSL